MDMHIKIPPELADFLKYLADANKVVPVDVAAHILHEAIYIAACDIAGNMEIHEDEPAFHTAARQVVTFGPSKLKSSGGQNDN